MIGDVIFVQEIRWTEATKVDEKNEKPKSPEPQPTPDNVDKKELPEA